MIIPIMPFYVESFGASAKALGLLMAIFSIAQFVFSPIWGNLSDRIGRKKVLLVGTFGNALSMLLFGLSNHLWMLFTFRGLSGILSSATLPVAMAYISDSTDEENRGGGMGVIGAAMGVGMVLGPGLGGWLTSQSTLSLPFYFASAFSVIASLLIIFKLPESHPVELRATKSANAPSRFELLWQSLIGPLGFLMLLSFLVAFALSNFEAIFGLYGQARLDYGPQQVGSIMAVVGVVSAVVQGAVTGPATRRFGEATIIRVSLITSAVGFFLMTLAWDTPTLLGTVGFFVLGNTMLRPAIASMISRNSGSNQGILLGVSNSFLSLGRVIGPLWAGFMFDVRIYLPYVSGAIILILIFVASIVWWKNETTAHRPTSEAISLSQD